MFMMRHFLLSYGKWQKLNKKYVIIINEVYKMELILIIAGEEYSENITSLLVKHGYYATEIGCNGEFLQYGDMVLLLGVEQGKSNEVIQILKEEGGKHPGMSAPFRNQVKIYVMSAARYKKINP